jgi:hypothetical protein
MSMTPQVRPAHKIARSAREVPDGSEDVADGLIGFFAQDDRLGGFWRQANHLAAKCTVKA